MADGGRQRPAEGETVSQFDSIAGESTGGDGQQETGHLRTIYARGDNSPPATTGQQLHLPLLRHQKAQSIAQMASNS